MTLYDKPLDTITDSDLQGLLGTDSESKTLEFKSALPGDAASDKKKFLAQVSSFANANGGDLIYGITTDSLDKGKPIEVSGLKLSNVDGEILRLTNIINDGLRPRIRFDIRPLQLKDTTKGVVIIIRVHRCFVQPHQIVFDKDFRFYSRNSAGKYGLDVDDLRTIFELTGTTRERIRSFRAERLNNVISGGTPVPLEDSARVVLHIFPLSAFGRSQNYDVISLAEPYYEHDYIRPLHMWSGGIFCKPNFDGLLRWDQLPSGITGVSEPRFGGYVQLFHNGIIEAVAGNIIDKPMSKGPGWPYIEARRFEKALIEGLTRYLSTLKKLGVEPPFLVMASLLNVKGHLVVFDMEQLSAQYQKPIDRDHLLVREVELDAVECNPEQVLRPIFDQVANAGGWPRSLNFDADGKWTGTLR